jgi:hypothetical protein
MSARHVLLPLVLTLLVACVSDQDRATMKEKMTLETERAKIWTAAAPDCKRLASESTAFNTQHHESLGRIATWWDALSPSKRKTLLDEHAAEDATTLRAMMLASRSCPEEVKAALRRGG